MNLNTIPDVVWGKLAAAAVQAVRSNGDVKSRVGDYFYAHIYEKWSEGKVKYVPNVPGRPDARWWKLVAEWKALAALGRALGRLLKDDSKGRAGVQQDPGRDELKLTRLWEVYNNWKVVARFQFVVSAGGGVVLFNRMRRACQTYILEGLRGDPNQSDVQGWKVFGEQGGAGRSDSCVVYLAVPFGTPAVSDMVEKYVWPNVRDLVDGAFVPLGLSRIGTRPLWAIDLPDERRERDVLGGTCGGSAGDLMATVLGLALAKAVEKEGTERVKLVAEAKKQAADLVRRLYA